MKTAIEAIARDEGIPLSQYVLYALTRQVNSAYRVQPTSAAEQLRTQKSWQALQQSLGRASEEELDRLLAEREPVAPEAELSPALIARLQQRIQERRPLN